MVDTSGESRSETRQGAKRRPASFAEIEAMLQRSAQGRWFLEEFTRRNRNADTEMLLRALARLEMAIESAGKVGASPGAKPAQETGGTVETVTKAAAALAEPPPPRAAPERQAPRPQALLPLQSLYSHLTSATEQLEKMSEETVEAFSQILAAAEAIQDATWEMRDKGVERALCEAIERRTADIYAACSFQDVAGQRKDLLLESLRQIHRQLTGMADARDATLTAAGPGKAAPPAPTRPARSAPEAAPLEDAEEASFAIPLSSGMAEAGAASPADSEGGDEAGDAGPPSAIRGASQASDAAAQASGEPRPAESADATGLKMNPAKRAAMFG